MGTEVPTTGDEAIEKDSTTVGLEYGRFVADAPEFEIHLVLYGTPGQERFRFMWETVAVGADGFIVLIDATRPETWEDALAALTFFAQNHAGDCIVGANRTDKDSPAFVALTDWLSDRASVPVVPCDVTNEQSDRCLLYTSPSPRDATLSRMPSSA